jgi:hypothetical protein
MYKAELPTSSKAVGPAPTLSNKSPHKIQNPGIAAANTLIQKNPFANRI